MLSAQCDKLRELATRCDELQVGAVRAVRVPLDMGSILREAADTIWELRNKCADLVDERERLFRANVEKNNEMLRLVGENAKLRELVRSVLVLRHDAVYKWLDATTAEVCGKSFTEQACELGIEVDA